MRATDTALAAILLAAAACTAPATPTPGPSSTADGPAPTPSATTPTPPTWQSQVCAHAPSGNPDLDDTYARLDVPDDLHEPLAALAADLTASDTPAQLLADRLADPDGPLADALADDPDCSATYVARSDVGAAAGTLADAIVDARDLPVGTLEWLMRNGPDLPDDVTVHYVGNADGTMQAEIRQPATGAASCIVVDDDGTIVDGPTGHPCPPA